MKKSGGLGMLGSAAIGAGTGLLGSIGQKRREERAMRNQRELMGIQFGSQKALNKQGQELQLDTWEKTSYPRQMELMKEAGLNPALMYGSAGSGGQTGSQGGGNAAGGNAPAPQPVLLGMITEMMKTVADVALKDKQQDNVAQDTAKKVSETAKVEGEIANLAQDIQNKKAQWRLTEAQTIRTKIENYINGNSKEYSVDRIMAESRSALFDMVSAKANSEVDKETINSRIKIFGAEAQGALIKNQAMKQGISLDKAKIQEIGARMQEMYIKLSQGAEGLRQGREGLKQKDRELNIKTFETEFKAEFPSLQNVGGRAIQSFFDLGAAIDNALYGTEKRKTKVD